MQHYFIWRTESVTAIIVGIIKPCLRARPLTKAHSMPPGYQGVARHFPGSPSSPHVKDPRLCLLEALIPDLFRASKVGDIGCNAGAVTVQLGKCVGRVGMPLPIPKRLMFWPFDIDLSSPQLRCCLRDGCGHRREPDQTSPQPSLISVLPRPACHARDRKSHRLLSHLRGAPAWPPIPRFSE